MTSPELPGLRPTGRQMRNPAATLHEMEDEGGRICTVVVFDEAYRGHHALTVGIDLVESFLQHPMVVGLVELSHWDRDQAAFCYPTGRISTLTEVLRAHADIGSTPGPRAALEVMLLASQILCEAGDTGPLQGCFSHGSLHPGRIALRLDGQLQIFGYGLAQVDLLAHLQDPARFPIAPESLRYTPPERLEGLPESAASDVWSVAAIAYEIATGRPLLASLDVEAIKRSIALSEPASLLAGHSHGLPDAMARMLARTFIFDPETRLSGRELEHELRTLLARPDIEGDDLATLMERLRGRAMPTARRGRKLVSAETGMFTPEDLAQLAEEEEEATASSTGSDPRWRRIASTPPRRDPAPAEEEARPRRRTQDAPTETDASRRLRRRTEAETPTPAPTAPPPAPAATAPPSPTPVPAAAPPPPLPAAAPAPPLPAPAPAAAAPPPPLPAPPPPAPAPPAPAAAPAPPASYAPPPAEAGPLTANEPPEPERPLRRFRRRSDVAEPAPEPTAPEAAEPASPRVPVEADAGEPVERPRRRLRREG